MAGMGLFHRNIRFECFHIAFFTSLPCPDPLPQDTLHNIAKSGIWHKGDYRHIPHMLNSTKKMLREFYSPFNAELRSILGEQFTWDYS